MVGPSDECNAPRAALEEVPGGVVGGHIAVAHHLRKTVGQTGAGEENERHVGLGEHLVVGVVDGVLRQTGDDAVHMEREKIVDGTLLEHVALVAVGRKHGVTVA